MLVSLRIQMDVKFQLIKTHKTLWDDIAKQMQEHGYHFNGPQCSNKWKSIKRDYKNVIYHNSKSGNGKKKKCKFIDDLNDLFGCKPSTRPTHTINSMEDESDASSRWRILSLAFQMLPLNLDPQCIVQTRQHYLCHQIPKQTHLSVISQILIRMVMTPRNEKNICPKRES